MLRQRMFFSRLLISRLLIILSPLIWLTLPMAAAPLTHSADRTLTVGETQILTFDAMTTASVGSPAVVDIVPLTGRQLLLSAKGVGETTLFVYDRRGLHRLSIVVTAVLLDLAPIAAQIQAEIGLPGVTARVIKDTIFLEGEVSGVVALQRAAAIAGVYTPHIKNLLAVLPPETGSPDLSLAQTYAKLLTDNLGGTGVKIQVIDAQTIALLGDYSSARILAAPDMEKTPARARYHRTGAKASGEAALNEMSLQDVEPASGEGVAAQRPLDRLIQSLPPELKVIDLLGVSAHPARQILVRAKIIDIDRTASKTLGLKWGTLDPISARAGRAYDFHSQPILFGQSPAGGGAFNTNLFGGGALERISPFAAQLNLLITENKARILSEPSLMVLDGNSGSILVGGEIPVPVAQGSNGTSGVSSSVTIQYKPYGVRLLVSAALVGESAVQMTVTPEVSELNYTNAVQISGFTIPALTVRRATSTLQMVDGETLIIGGLYSNTMSRQVERVPLLSQIPILGEFFKNTTTRKDENELLIIIQTQIVAPETPGIHPPPLGSRENPVIGKPAVEGADFNRDFPNLPKKGR